MQYEVVPAGLWNSTIIADHDFETFSEAGYVWHDGQEKYVCLDNASKKGLEVVGTAVYMEHPTADILSYAYDLKDGRGDRIWMPGLPNPQDLFDYIAAGGLIEAWNAGFEFLAWNIICTRRYGWPVLPLSQVRCAMAKARAFGLPGALGKAARACGTLLKEDALGKQVLDRYSKPRNPTKKDFRRRITPTDPGESEWVLRLLHYNVVDIKSEAEISRVTPDLSPFELAVWQLDQKINLRGIPIDMPLVNKCIEILKFMEEKHNAELYIVSDRQLSTYTEVSAMQVYLSTYWGVQTNSLDEDAIDELLKSKDLHPQPRRVLEIRQIMSSAGVKKLYALSRMTSEDGRIRMLYQYHSAHTGRFAAGGLQPHNMKSSGPSLSYCKICDEYFAPTVLDSCRFCEETAEVVPGKEWDADMLLSVIDYLAHEKTTPEKAYGILAGETLPTLAASIRGLVCAPPGKEFICSDYSAIEAVGLAMLAGEQWRIEVFRTHGKIYEQCAADITGVPFEEILAYKKKNGYHHPHRKPFGKIPELASGYGGWIGAWKQFGADEFMDDATIKKNILKWRAKSPRIVELWGGQWRQTGYREFTQEYYGLEGMAVLAVLNPGQVCTYRMIQFMMFGDVLYCRLPSGRCLAYPQPRLTEVQDRFSGNPVWQLSYMLYNTNPKKGPMKAWIRVSTYGGDLTNHVTQGTCRDIFVQGMLNVDHGGYPVVLHTHDELCSEVDEGYGNVEEFERLMMTPAPWYADWPIKARDGWRGKRYRK